MIPEEKMWQIKAENTTGIKKNSFSKSQETA